MPTLKAIHIAKSHKADRITQNLPISMSLPTLIEMLTKFEIINESKIKHESTTKNIVHLADSANYEYDRNK